MVDITTSDDWSTVVAGQSAGTTFNIRAGIHRNQVFTHKAGNSYICEDGVDIRGTETVALGDWTVAGSLWYIEVNIPLQTTSSGGGFDFSANASYRPYINIDLFEVSDDGETWRPFMHKTTSTGLGAYEYYLDTSASPDRLYIGVNPNTYDNLEVSGSNEHLCESTVTGNFTWRGGRIRGYRCTRQNGALFLDNIDGTVTVENAIFEWNHWKGITASGALFSNLRINYNGQMGFSMTGDDGVVYGCQVNYNNTWLTTHLGSENALFNMYWEAGGTKCVRTRRLYIISTEVNYNGGPGIWLDIDNYAAYVYNCHAIQNYRPHGIYSEIGGRATFIDCFIADNGVNESTPSSTAGMFSAQIRLANVSYNTVTGCTVIVPDIAGTDRSGGIGITYTDRGSGGSAFTTDSGETYLRPRNNRIFNNDVYYRGLNDHQEGFVALVEVPDQSASYTNGEYFNNKWWDNVYHRRSEEDTAVDNARNVYVYANAAAGSLATWNGSAFTRGSGDTENFADDTIPSYPTLTYQRKLAYTDIVRLIGVLVQYFPFDSDLTDASGYGINATTAGTVNHATTHALADGSGYAAFDTDFVDMSSSLATTFSDYEFMRMTVFAWYYRATADGATTWQDVWQLLESSSTGFKANAVIDPAGNNKIRWVYRTDGDTNQSDTSADEASVYDTWRTIAQRMVADHPDGASEEKMDAFLDGAFELTDPHTSGAITLSSMTRRRIAGSEAGTQTSQIDMAHFAWFADALMDEEIALLHNSIAYPSPVVAKIADQTDDEGDSVSFSVSATDPNSLTLTYSATGLPGGVSINSGTGAFTGTLSGTSAGRYYPVVTVANSEGEESEVAFLWTVAESAGNAAPVWSTISDKSNTENDEVSVTISVSDADTCAISVTGLPTGLSYVDNGDNTATISGIVTEGASGSSPFSVTASADDGTNAAVEEEFEWSIAPFISTASRYGVDECVDCEDILELIVGVSAIDGDANSNDVQQGQLDYFALDDKIPFGVNREILWTPNIAAPENGGSWQSSANLEGRRPTSLKVGNVTEVVQLYFNTPSYNDYTQTWTHIQRIVALARDFNTTYSQTDPVYLKWKNRRGKSQYALILNMNAVATMESDDGNYNMRVSIDIEREPAWRPLPPFSNPKLWSLYVNDTKPTASNVSLINGLNDWKSATLDGKHEYDSTDYNGTPLSQNYVDISANEVPGDAPAKVMVVFKKPVSDTSDTREFVIARSSKKLIATGHDGSTNYQTYNFNGGDASVTNGGGKTMTKPTGTGFISNGSNVNKAVAQAVVTNGSVYNDGTTYISPLVWGSGALSTGRKYIDKHLLRGRYAVFFRGGILASTSNVYARVQYAEVNATDPVKTIGEVAVLSGGTVQTHYVGDVTIPLSGSVSSTDGRGSYVSPNTSFNCEFRMDFRNSSGASQTIIVWEMFIVPIDECAVRVKYSQGRFLPTVSASDGAYAIYDNTGYMNRELDRHFGQMFSDDVTAAPMEVYGSPIELTPNKDQRIYIFSVNNLITEKLAEGDFYFNILPRWYGVRDK